MTPVQEWRLKVEGALERIEAKIEVLDTIKEHQVLTDIKVNDHAKQLSFTRGAIIALYTILGLGIASAGVVVAI